MPGSQVSFFGAATRDNAMILWAGGTQSWTLLLGCELLEWEWVQTACTPARRAPAAIGAAYVTQQALPNPRDGVMLSIPRRGHAMARHYLYATLIAGAQVAEHELVHLR